MARPQKDGLDYFPMDVDMDQDDKIYILEAECGLEGFALAIKLLMKIYNNGYYLEWGDREAKIFARKKSADINVVNNVVNVSINEGLFDKNIYEKYGVLTSSGIQKRFFKAAIRRKELEYNSNFMLIDVSEYDNLVNVNNNSGSDDINSTNSTQSKVKESKVKDSKEKEKKNPKNFFEENQKELEPFMQIMSKDVVYEAVKKSVNKDSPLAYCKAVLGDWNKKNIKQVKDLSFVSKSNSKGSNEDGEYKWASFFIDFDKYKE